MRAFEESDKISLADLEKEQELMRILSDIISDIYTMRTVILRSSQSEGEIHKQIESVVSEEKLREIRRSAGSILSRLLTGDKQIEYVNELKDMINAQHTNII